ncbi:MAG TPA: helix-turn-helix transcriptional regulator [Kofleriaceae bacterium]|nr:helix-turn-helix transcriptional regulator [Kofleriaceae bacterium]
MQLPAQPIGPLLRQWRERRRMSQLALALDANISAKHVSFVESGRASPSRDMVLALAEALAVPLRARNALLLAAGFAPAYPELGLDAPELAAARRAVDLVLAGHEPYPAIAIDRHWQLVAANRAFAPLVAGISPALLAPPVNVLRLSFHPEGLAPRILNFPDWRAHALHRLQHQVDVSGDPVLAALLDELGGGARLPAPAPSELYASLRIRVGARDLAFLSATTVFGTPVDVTLSELAIESFFPADTATAEALRAGI